MSVFLKRVETYCDTHGLSQMTKMKLLGHYPLFKAHWHARYGKGLKKTFCQQIVSMFRGYKINHQVPSKNGEPIEIPISFEPEDLSSFEEIFWGNEYALPWDLHSVRSYVDLGANTGMAALYFKTQAPLEKVVLVEANPKLVKILEKNTPTAKIENICVSGTSDETIEFYISKGHRHSSMEPDASSEKITHSTISLSKLLKKHDLEEVDLLKMDIEGAEYSILKNDAQGFFQCRHIVAETHGVKSDRDEFSRQLEALGFEVHRDDKGYFDCETLFARKRKAS